mgnify:CR=1 FL=1
MATISRRLLVMAAILLLAVGLAINIADGGSTLLVVAAGLALIFAILTWSLFDATSKPAKVRGSTPIQSDYSMGKSLSELQDERQEQTLPDPLESGYEIPLM